MPRERSAVRAGWRPRVESERKGQTGNRAWSWRNHQLQQRDRHILSPSPAFYATTGEPQESIPKTPSAIWAQMAYMISNRPLSVPYLCPPVITSIAYT